MDLSTSRPDSLALDGGVNLVRDMRAGGHPEWIRRGHQERDAMKRMSNRRVAAPVLDETLYLAPHAFQGLFERKHVCDVIKVVVSIKVCLRYISWL